VKSWPAKLLAAALILMVSRQVATTFERDGFFAGLIHVFSIWGVYWVFAALSEKVNQDGN